MERSLLVEIGADLQPFDRNLARAGGLLTQFASNAERASGRVSGAFERPSGGIGRLIGTVQGAGNSFAQFGSRAASALSQLGSKAEGLGRTLTATTTLPLAAAGIGALKLAGDNEKAAVSFGVLLGSADKAKSVLTDLKQFSANTPFEFPEVQSAAKSLLAFGFSADQLKPTLTALGDIASGIDAPIGEIAEIYGKARTQGRLFSEDINQLTGRGIPIISELAKQFGVTEGEVKKLVESGKVNFGNLETAFQNLTKEGGKFGGLMKAQSETIPGLYDSTIDVIKQGAADIGTSLASAINLKGLLLNVNAFASGAAKAFTSLGPTTQSLIFGFAGVAAATGPLLLGIGKVAALAPTIVAGFTAVKGAFSSLTALGPLLAGVSLPVLAIGAAVAVTAGLVIFYWKDIKKVLTDTGIWQAASEAASSAMAFIRAAIVKASEVISAIWTVIRGAFSAGTEFISAIWQRFGPAITSVATTLFTQLTTIFRSAFSVLSQLFGGFTALLQGNWRDFGASMVNIGIIFTNTLTSLIAGTVKGIIGLAAGLFDAFGADQIAAKIRSYSSTVDSVAARLKISLIETRKEAEKTGKAIGTAQAAAAKGVAGASRTKPGATTTAAGLPKVTKDDKVPAEVTDSYKEAATALEFWQEIAARAKKEITELLAQGAIISPQLLKNLDVANTKIKTIEDSLRELAERKPIDIPLKVSFGSLGNIQQTAMLAFQGQDESLGGKAAEFKAPTLQPNGAPELPGLEAFKQRSAEYNKAYREFQNNLSRIPDSMQELKDKLNTGFASTTKAISDQAADMAEKISEAALAIKAVAGSVGANLLSSLGESLGAGNTNPLKSALKSILDMVAGYAIQIGTALLLSSAALLAAAPFTAGITLAPGIGQKVAGAGLIVAGGLIKGLAGGGGGGRAMAEGGLVYGRTNAVVGEYAGAANDPEMVGRLSTVTGYINQAVSSAIGPLRSTLSGLQSPSTAVPDMKSLLMPALPNLSGSGQKAVDVNMKVDEIRLGMGYIAVGLKRYNESQSDING